MIIFSADLKTIYFYSIILYSIIFLYLKVFILLTGDIERMGIRPKWHKVWQLVQRYVPFELNGHPANLASISIGTCLESPVKTPVLG